MDILDNRLLGTIFGILLLVVFFFIKNKKIEAFGLWGGLLNTAFRLVEKPIGFVMRKLGGMASTEVNKVTGAVEKQARNALSTGQHMARSAIRDARGMANRAMRDAKGMANRAMRDAKGMANNAIRQTKGAVTNISNKVQRTIQRVAANTMKSITHTIRQVVSTIQKFVLQLMEQIKVFFTKTIMSALVQGRERAKEVWRYVVDSTYGKIKNFTNRVKIHIMKFLNYYIKMAKPYSLYIAIGAGILGVGGLGTYIYFNFFHDPNAKPSNNNNTPVNNNNTPVNNNNTPVNNTPVDIPEIIPQTIPQTIPQFQISIPWILVGADPVNTFVA